MIENIDYYINEQGLLVFTKEYHLKRGYCCKSGCMHCNWKEKNKNEKASGADEGLNKV